MGSLLFPSTKPPQPSTSTIMMKPDSHQDDTPSRSRRPGNPPSRRLVLLGLPSSPRPSPSQSASKKRSTQDQSSPLVRSNAVHYRAESSTVTPTYTLTPRISAVEPNRFCFQPENWWDTPPQSSITPTPRDSSLPALPQKDGPRSSEINLALPSDEAVPPVLVWCSNVEKDDNKESLESRVKWLENRLKEQERMLKMLVGEVDSSQTDTESFAAVAKDIKSQLHDSKRLLSSVSPALYSRRGVLVLKSMQHQQRKTHPGSLMQGGNGVQGFDDPLSISDAADIAQALDTNPKLLDTDATCLRVCVLCNIPRFVRVPVGLTSRTTGKPSEFSSGDIRSSCCQQYVCDSWMLPAILSSLTRDWWCDLGYQSWIRCPVPDCRSAMTLFYHVQSEELCRQLGNKEYKLHTAQFTMCRRLRLALSQVNPRPGADALGRAAALHRQLAAHGRMLDPLDHPSASANNEDVTIKMMPVDSADGSHSLLVPVFVNQFVRTGGGSQTGLVDTTTEPHECIICTEAPPDVVAPTSEDEARWSAAIEGFSGDWTHQIREFPSPSALATCAATHPLNICRRCLDRHIATQLDSRGLLAAASDEDFSFSPGCPTPGCRHVYTHHEVRLLTDGTKPETFARYDRLKLLANLSAQPDFRWCLRAGCGSGQIHLILDQLGDGPRDRRRNRVECRQCGFGMCFRHQIPWHRGLTCDEYDRMRAGPGGGGGGGHGTEEEEATRRWLESNTKLCTRCGAYVEKRGGCFHMTCGSCGFEFCWECLADWSRIQMVDGRTGRPRGYIKHNHAPGCWFRGENAVLPTQMMGSTLEEALERIRR